MAPRDSEPGGPPGDDRWILLAALGQQLGSCFGASPPPLDPGQDWPAVVDAASRHMVAPALGWAWAARSDLPPEVAQVLGALLAMNRERNVRLLTGVEELLVRLNGDGITPVLLKGVGMLADQTYPDAGMRVILDCDLLIPPPALARAARTLADTGYLPTKTTALRGSHQLPAYRHVSTGMRVELHHAPVPRDLAGLVSASACFDNGAVVAVGAGQALLPAIEDRVAHNIAHAQLMDQRRRMARPQLRQLLDVAMFRRRHDASIDWSAISDRFRRAGFHAVLMDNLGLVEALLGQRAPAGLGGGATRAAQRVRRALARGPLARTAFAVQWTLQDAARMFAADPRWIGVWIANARERGSLTAGIRHRARVGD